MNPLVSQLLHRVIVGKVSSTLQQVNASVEKSKAPALEVEAIELAESWLLGEAKQFGFDVTAAAAPTT